MNLPFYIAKRYFFSKKRGSGFNLISVISAISMLGYIVGAAALIVVLSVFNGFEVLFASLYTNFDSDLKIVPASGKVIYADSLDWDVFNREGIIAYSKIVEENVLLRYNNQQTIATLKGVDTNYNVVTGFDSTLIHGVVDIKRDKEFAAIGQGIAYRLSIDPDDVFKSLAIYVPKRNVNSFIRPDDAFNKAVILPGAVFAVQDEVDDKFIICPLPFCLELLERNNEISAIEIKLNPEYNSSKLKAGLEEALGQNYLIKNRFEQHESFYKVMKSEKTISYIILLFILLIAASNTISSLYILLVQKKQDLYVLKSIGLNERQSGMIFTMEGLIMAAAGGGAGIILGVFLCYLQQEYGFVSLTQASDIMFSAYPVKVVWADVLLVFVTVMVLGFITTIYPAQQAKRMVR